MSAVETFEHIIRHQTAGELVPFLLALEKKDVVTVRAKLKSLKKELESMEQTSKNSWRIKGTDEQLTCLFLSGFAVYSRREALSPVFGGAWALGSFRNTKSQRITEFFLVLIKSLRPDWLNDWLTYLHNRASEWAMDYTLLRMLEKEALITHSPTLTTRSLANSLFIWGWKLSEQLPSPDNASKSIADIMREDSLLLARDLPLLFDFESPVNYITARIQPTMPLGQKGTTEGKERLFPWQVWNQKHPPQQVTWQDVIVCLTGSGHLARPDILARCLLALRRDFRRPLLTWFKNLFLALKPTSAERLALQTELTELLAQPQPLVVNFALDQLKDLWSHPAFTPAPFLLYAEALVTRQDLKTGLRTLLAAFEKLLKRDATLAPALARLSATALANADAAVQERAANLLARLLQAPGLLSADEQAEATATSRLYADLLGAAARQVLAPWLREQPAAETDENPATYAPLPAFVPTLSPATAIVPVRDWHELLFLTGQVLRHDDPAALERWLDGLLRLRGEFPAGYAAQLRPYVLQVFPQLKQLPDNELTATLAGPSQLSGHAGLAQALLLSWATGFTTPQVATVNVRGDYSTSDPLVGLEKQRLAALEQHLRQRTGLALLSTPTHAPYWVAPTALVQKLLAYELNQTEPAAADLAVALARTAFAHPEEARAALALLPQLQHEALRELLHWFLSPDEATLPVVVTAKKAGFAYLTERLSKLLPHDAAAPGTVSDALPWLGAVAARTKFPSRPFPELLPLPASDCPGLAYPWEPQWEFEVTTNTYTERGTTGPHTVTHRSRHISFPATYSGKAAPSPLLLYAQHVRFVGMQHASWLLGADYPFLAALLPLNPSPLYWHAVRTAGWADGLETAERGVIGQALRSLLLPGPAFEASATLVLAIGLTHKTPVCRALALEALLASCDQQRLRPPALGQTLGKLLAAEFVPLQRLTDTLAQARAISPLVDDALHQTLDALLPALPAGALRNTRKLLDAYADLTARSRRPVPAPVQARLHEWQAAPSLKKAAATLLNSC